MVGDKLFLIKDIGEKNDNSISKQNIRNQLFTETKRDLRSLF